MQTYVVKAFNTAKLNVQVHRPGLSVQFQNRLHDDDVAQLFGFAAGLVPGVDLYAYLCHLPVAHWGRSFLERGTMSAKFLKPVYDGESVSLSARETKDGLELAAEVRGEICAIGEASLSDRPQSLPSWTSFEAPTPRPYKVPASETSLQIGDWLGSHTFETPGDWASDFLKDMRESELLYERDGIIHPGQIVRMFNWAVIDNVSLVPWLYVGSTVNHLAAAMVGQPLTVRAQVTKNHERKGHKLLELDAVVMSADRPVARGTHVVIYEPRQALTAFRHQQETVVI